MVPIGTIATPCREMIHTEYALSLFRLQKPGEVGLLHFIGWAVASQRNKIVEAFLGDPNFGDWLLFIDSDMMFPEDALLRLLAHGDRDIVGAVCIQKGPPWDPAVWLPDGSRIGVKAVPKEPFAAGALGMAFTLIRRRVFEKISRPWFELGQMESEKAGEDVFFCAKALRAGFTLLADPTIKVWHLLQAGVALGPDGAELQYAHQRWFK